jgi:hypothetical protein
MFAPAFPFPPSEGERLLRDMEAKIVAAKTLRIDFEIETPPGFLNFTGRSGPPTKFTGSLALGDRNRFRYELKGPFPGILISDGRRIGGEWLPMNTGRGDPTLPDWHNEVLRQWLGRGGTLMSMLAMSQVLGAKPIERPAPTDGPRTRKIRRLPDEDVQKVKAHVVEYDLTWAGAALDLGVREQATKVKVWIDPKTSLPIRRTMTLETPAPPSPRSSDTRRPTPGSNSIRSLMTRCLCCRSRWLVIGLLWSSCRRPIQVE